MSMLRGLEFASEHVDRNWMEVSGKWISLPDVYKFVKWREVDVDFDIFQQTSKTLCMEMVKNRKF